MKGLTADIFKGKHGSSDGIGKFSSQFSEVTILAWFSHDITEPTVLRDESVTVMGELNRDDKGNKIIYIGSYGPFEPTKDAPPVVIVTRMIGNRPYYTAYIVNDDMRIERNRMFGGTFIYTSDSRFAADYPIPLHDRKES